MDTDKVSVRTHYSCRVPASLFIYCALCQKDVMIIKSAGSDVSSESYWKTTDTSRG